MSQQWTPPPPVGGPANIPNYLVPAILATLFCCLPLGVVSIIFATQVNSKVAAGDIAGAMEASRKAKMFLFIAVGGGLLALICYVVLMVLGFGMGALQNIG